MTDREKAIWGLECCMRENNTNMCGDCPYHDSSETRFGCMQSAMRNALALLKVQEPRVMTLEEIEDCDSAIWIEFKSSIYPAIYHDRHGKWLFITRKSQCWLGAEKHYADNYNKTWRCWTSHPTDEQRKAVKWDVRDE